MIEIIMTIALVMYFVAFICARRRLILGHIIIAVVAFSLDAFGTFLMFTLDSELTNIIFIHTILTLIAISLFIVQAYLGITKQKRKHIFFAENVFLPAWVISYMSGFLLLLL